MDLLSCGRGRWADISAATFIRSSCAKQAKQ